MAARGVLRPALTGATPRSQTLKGCGREKGQTGVKGAWRPHQALAPKHTLLERDESSSGSRLPGREWRFGGRGGHRMLLVGHLVSLIPTLDSALPGKFSLRYKAQVKSFSPPTRQLKFAAILRTEALERKKALNHGVCVHVCARVCARACACARVHVCVCMGVSQPTETPHHTQSLFFLL